MLLLYHYFGMAGTFCCKFKCGELQKTIIDVTDSQTLNRTRDFGVMLSSPAPYYYSFSGFGWNILYVVNLSAPALLRISCYRRLTIIQVILDGMWLEHSVCCRFVSGANLKKHYRCH